MRGTRTTPHGEALPRDELLGREAVAVGVRAALAGEDVIGSTHRAHGHVLAKGTPPREVMAELYGENDRWSESTPQSRHQPIADLTARAAAFGMDALHVDGQDVEQVRLAAGEALAHARDGRGPVFLLCETERLTGHYVGDAQVYRDEEELRRLRETRDPVRNLRERLEGGRRRERLRGATTMSPGAIGSRLAGMRSAWRWR